MAVRAGTATRARREAFAAAFNQLHPKFFKYVQDHAAEIAALRFGANNPSNPLFFTVIGRAGIDARWFRIWVWKNAQRAAAGQQPAFWPDYSLIPAPPAATRAAARPTRNAEMPVRVLVDGWSLRRVAKK